MLSYILYSDHNKLPKSVIINILEECIKISANSMTMYSKYWLSYTQTIFKLIDSMNPSNHAKLTANRNNGYFTPHTFYPIL